MSPPASAPLHRWDLDYREAVELQLELRDRLIERPFNPRGLRLVCGADVSSSKRSPLIHAAAVLFDLETFEIVESATASLEATTPYIPGLLSFREGPAVLAATAKLERAPDAVIFDGQGYAHPRRLGLAAHLGLWLGVPTVGCAKTRLVGEHSDPPDVKGTWVPLTDGGELIGAVLRTRVGVKPVFVSRGHLCDLESAVGLVTATARRFRLPEPVRAAHSLCNEVRRRAESS
jgi:deoxyribonuclease V